MDTGGYLGDVVAILAAGVLVALLVGRTRVASIAGLVLAGVLIGPGGLGLVGEAGHVDVLADVGVALLLFGIGLELTPKKLRTLRREVFVGGTLQVLLTTGAAAGVALLLGLSLQLSVFLGCVAALSSTAVVLSRLDQRQELTRPHGRLALGILVLQDVAVVPMVLLVPVLAGADLEASQALAQIAVKTAFVVATVVVGRYVARIVLGAVARSGQRDVYLLATVLMCLGTAWLAAVAGVSLAVGAFLGGVVVASTPFRHQSLAQVAPLRDLFTSFFFVSIGMLLDPQLIAARPLAVLGLTLALIGGKALLTFAVALAGGWSARVAASAALALAQVGEFSFVLTHAAQGTALLPESLAQPLFAAIALSLLLTPALVDAAPRAGGWLGRTRLGRWLERTVSGEPELPLEVGDHVVVAGFGPAGRLVVKRLARTGVQVSVVDLNPENVERAREAGVRALYGDAADPVVLRAAGVADATAIVIAISDAAATDRAVRAARSVAPGTRILVRAAYSSTASQLRTAGADDVVDFETSGAHALADLVDALPLTRPTNGSP
jgi:CPA2 family monovalent cation:H+ antiporter-2